MGTLAPIVGAEVRLHRAKFEPETTSTGTEGSFSVAGHEPVRFELSDATLRLAKPRAEYVDGTDVYAGRLASIVCHFDVIGSSGPAPTVRIVASPISQEPGEWVPDPSRVGSSAWLSQHGPGLYASHAQATSSPVTMAVPVFPEVTFAATAEGFIPDRCSARLDASGTPAEPVRLVLRKARRIVVQVVDDLGSPVAGATFQFAIHRSEPRETANPAIELMQRELDGSAVTMRSSPAGGWAETSRIVQSQTDMNGRSAVDQPGPGGDETIVVWASGFRTHVQRRPAPSGEEAPIEVRLEKFSPMCEFYRLVRGGKVLMRVSVILAEPLDGGFTPAMPTISSDGQGRIASGPIVPGTPYIATVIDHEAKSTYTGRLTFLSTRDVDIDSLVR